MSLKKTFASWVIALMIFSWVVLALTIVELYYIYEEEAKHHEDIQSDFWSARNIDIHIDLAIQLIGIVADIMLLVGILWEIKTLIITWLVIVPFRIAAHIAGTVYTLSIGRGGVLTKALAGLRIVLAAMLLYSLYVGSRYYIQVTRRKYINVDKIPEARMTVLLGGGGLDESGDAERKKSKGQEKDNEEKKESKKGKKDEKDKKGKKDDEKKGKEKDKGEKKNKEEKEDKKDKKENKDKEENKEKEGKKEKDEKKDKKDEENKKEKKDEEKKDKKDEKKKDKEDKEDKEDGDKADKGRGEGKQEKGSSAP